MKNINVKCPKCKEKISYLINVQSGSMGYISSLGKDGYLDYNVDRDGFIPDDNINYYGCPKCNKELFYSDEDAIKFLKGKTKR